MDAETKRRAVARLRLIAGQVQGVQRMVEDEKYCVDTLLQISAVQGALEQLSRLLMARHIEHCVRESLLSGSDRERARKIEELVALFGRHGGFPRRGGAGSGGAPGPGPEPGRGRRHPGGGGDGGDA